MSEPQLQKPIIVGRIAGAFGIKGDVRVESWTQPFDNLRTYNPWLIGKGEQWQSYKIENVAVAGQRLTAHLEGVGDPDAARRLYGLHIAITTDQMATLPKGEYYWTQIEGLRVLNKADIELGIVSHLMDVGAHNVMVVKSKDGEHLIPYVKQRTILEVDLNAGVIKVDWELDW